MKVTYSLLLALGFGLVACDKEKPADNAGAAPSASTTATTTAAASTTASASAVASTNAPDDKKPRRRGGFGMASMMLKAAEDKVPEAKQTVADLRKKLMDGETPKDEMKTLHDDMVAGVKAGKIDVAKIDADRAAAEKAMQAQKDKEADTLNALHASLKPEQRKAVVAEVRDNMKKRADKMEAKMKDNKPEMKGDMKGAQHAMMFKDIDLDADQQKKVDAILAKDAPKKDKPDWEAMRAEMKKKTDAFLDAFEKDGFDAKKLADDKDKDKDKHMGMGPMDPKKMNEVLAVLKPEQREKLAAKMDKMHGPGGPKMGHHPGAPGGADDDDDGDNK